ncbi:MAG: hypothetical protein QMD09_13630 [Desulfatibacillaceae bacterium]|nr:hypothetical protein [Desulfatibacillaceae bacterium]
MNRYLKQVVISIWGGRRACQNLSVEAILGVEASKATLDDLEKLNRRQSFALFLAAQAPDFFSLKGEYRAVLLGKDPLTWISSLYINNFFGPGRWIGKAFFATSKMQGRGYNILQASGDDAPIFRVRMMNTQMGLSQYDHKQSFLLDYSAYNKFPVSGMRDEIRKINDNLFIGLGGFKATGGPFMPAPFALAGPPEKWVGPDEC